MEKPSVTHCTFVIERSYPATPERVFSAFADPDKKRRWFAGSDSRDVEEFQMDFRVGGVERTRSRIKGGPLAGTAMTNDTSYHDIIPNHRVVLAYTMSLGDRRISASLATIELRPADQGTDLIFTDQGAFFEGSDGPQMREEGWRKLLERLAQELASQSRDEPVHAARRN